MVFGTNDTLLFFGYYTTVFIRFDNPIFLFIGTMKPFARGMAFFSVGLVVYNVYMRVFSFSRAKSKLKLRQLQNEKSALELQVEVLQKELLLIRSWVNQPKNEPPEMDGQGVMQNTDYPLLASAGSEEFKWKYCPSSADVLRETGTSPFASSLVMNSWRFSSRFLSL